MGRTCCVKTLCKCNPDSTKHVFPIDPDRRTQWLENLPSGASLSPQHLCSAHFNENCYKTQRCDSNQRRSGVGESLQRSNILKDDAIPTIWPNLPDYLSKRDARKRDSVNSSVLRCIDDDEKPSCSVATEEKLLPPHNKLVDFAENLDLSIYSQNVFMVHHKTKLTIVSLDYSDDGKPQIDFSQSH